MRSKAQRRKDSAAIEYRFPKGSGKGDTLADTVALGNSFHRINSLSFGSIGKSGNPKRFAQK